MDKLSLFSLSRSPPPKPQLPARHLPLGEEVPVGAAMLQGDAIALAADTVADHGHRAIIVGQGRVLHHRHIPQEGIVPLLCLQEKSAQSAGPSLLSSLQVARYLDGRT